MKPAFVSDLQADQSITTFFLVCEKEVRATREGKPYLRLELGDRTGRIEARMWEGFDADAFDREDYVKVQARVENYRNKLQLSVDKIRRAEDREVDPADYFPHTAHDVEQLYAKLLEFVAAVANPWLRRLLEDAVRDPEVVPRLKRAPAAKLMHHAYLGGLLEHMVSLCGLCRVVAAYYPETDADLLLTGAVLHDLGKVEELSYERSLGYTDEGQLLGHILIEFGRMTNKMDAMAGFPPDLKILVQHMLASHHGQYEFGSPKLPMFREALMLHYLDDLDSKLGAVRAALDSPTGEGNWTVWSAALGRRVLRVAEFRRAEEARAKNAPAEPRQNAVKSSGAKG